MPGPNAGIGPALREARESLGKSLEEASRDTKIKFDHLQALERENFEALGGDVYVRGTLRSYSSYLGLDPDKVLSAYSEAIETSAEAADEEEPPPPVEPKPIRTLHRRANWKLAFLVAVVLLVSAGVGGLLSRHVSTTPSVFGQAPSPTSSPSASPFDASDLASVYLVASKPVKATVIADGMKMFHGMLKPGKPQTVTASTLARVWLSRGGLVDITVNGHDLGAPGTKKAGYAATFTPFDYRERPSPAA